MSLAEVFESKFRADIRFRGEAYFDTERVAITRITSNQVSAIVRDGEELQTTLMRDDDGNLKLFCPCARAQKSGVCKHLWGTIVAIDAEGCLSASPRPGYVPPFASEVPSFEPLEEDWEDEEPAEAGPRMPAARTQRRSVATAEPKLKPWQSRLRELRSRMAEVEPTTGTGREREVLYRIDVDNSRSTGQLVVETSQRQRRANGGWGKLKPLKIRSDRLDEIESAEDRRILAYLLGGTAERGNWHAQQVETQTLASRFRVPHELCELVVPLMCGTERVQFTDSAIADEPVQWDDGPPWELSVHVEHDDGDDPQWVVKGELHRESETLGLDAAVLLLPGGLVVTRTHVARLRDFGASEWLDLLQREPTLEVPAGDAGELVEELFDMPRLPRLELPEELRLEEVRCEPVPRLLIRSPKRQRWQGERLQGDVVFSYDGSEVRGSSSQWAIVQRERRQAIVRDHEQEARYWSQLQDAGFRRLVDRHGRGHDVEISGRDLGPAVRTLVGIGWEVAADGNPVREPGEPEFRIRSDIDWFDLEADVDFDGRTVPFPELLSALSRGDSMIRLDDGSYGVLPEEWMQQFGVLSGLAVSDGESVRFRHNQVPLLDALLANQPQVDFDEGFLELRERFRRFEGVDERDEPEGFEGELRHYQQAGLGWLTFLQEFRLGGCLADDMGLGKTVQLLALLLERVRNRDERLPSLVVVPKSLMFNWVQEAHRFTPELTVLEYTGTNRADLRSQFAEHDLVLTTYGTLRRDAVTLKDERFDYVVLDEAQTIKNAGSQVAKASRLLQANHRVALSGTPIENHLGDLWSIFEFLNPGMLGHSSAFKLFAADPEDESSRRLLSHGLRPFILRRTKQQVAAELPEKFEQTLVCEMGERQQQMYADMREHYRQSLLGMVRDQGLNRSKMHVLEALLRLRQAACHPGLLDEEAQDEPFAKLETLLPQLHELLEEGHKALVFSQFTSMLSIVRNHLEREDISYEYLDGRTRDRKARVERFQSEPDCGVFLISLKAGGLGLNLTAADYVFLLDPWWNPAVETQAIDRAHRVGQTKHVFAYRLITHGTVEEKIAELQSQKRELADAILEANDDGVLKSMTAEDLEMLLS